MVKAACGLVGGCRGAVFGTHNFESAVQGAHRKRRPQDWSAALVFEAAAPFFIFSVFSFLFFPHLLFVQP